MVSCEWSMVGRELRTADRGDGHDGKPIKMSLNGIKSSEKILNNFPF